MKRWETNNIVHTFLTLSIFLRVKVIKKVTMNSFYYRIFIKEKYEQCTLTRLSDFYKMTNIKIHVLKIHGYLIYNWSNI